MAFSFLLWAQTILFLLQFLNLSPDSPSSFCAADLQENEDAISSCDSDNFKEENEINTISNIVTEPLQRVEWSSLGPQFAAEVAEKDVPVL